MTTSGLKHLPPDRPIKLQNDNCPYCGEDIVEGNWNEEHVIGRRFVPRGALAKSWNVHLRVCVGCNSKKADLEDDLSAITMQPSPAGDHARPDPLLAIEARRKGAGSKSRRTRRPIAQSAETMQFSGSPMQGVQASVSLVGPPQAEPDRVLRLAWYHAHALFFLVTYNETTRRGGFFTGEFSCVGYSLRSDWGSGLNRAFMNGVSKWEPRVVAVAADGYFKAAIRRHPEVTCWSWALEWNHNLRVIGFAGDKGPIKGVFEGMPPQRSVVVNRGADGSITRLRLDVALPADEDALFDE